ncbi:T3SS effector HopA1 family protein [Nocardiopsis halotolerans]|uniref:T3SS effector HopA1 family protein n=1 Tax=Nocardiopsis halotolerans TaxID=124252 RepID=UPI000349ECDF|nr:T3SS effector HopA1 family protein [Nocardiopsis halotolerans]
MSELDLRTGTRSAAHITDIVRLDTRTRTLSVGEHQRTAPDTPESTAELTAWLYAVTHTGNPDVFSPDSVLADPVFEEDIRSRLPDPGLLVPVREVGEATDGSALAELHRVRLRLTGDQLVRDGDDTRVRVSCLRPNLTPGFFMYLHETGAGARPGDRVTRYYLGGADPDSTLDLWARGVDRLVTAGAGFRTKILSRRAAYPRNDAAVYYVLGDTSLFEEVMTDLLAGEETAAHASPLCAPHPSGLYTAHEPVDPRPGQQQRSYGEHRCAAIAEAVIRAVRDGVGFQEALVESFTAANIDSGDVARNHDGVPTPQGAPA